MKVKAGEKDLKRIGKELDKLVDAVLSGTLEKDTIKNEEKSLVDAKVKASEELEEHRARVRSMPDIERVKAEAEQMGLLLVRQDYWPTNYER
jgi:hypothetical protein